MNLAAAILWITSMFLPGAIPQAAMGGHSTSSGGTYTYVGTNKAAAGLSSGGGSAAVSCSGGTLTCTTGDDVSAFFFISSGGSLSGGTLSVIDNSGDTATQIELDTTSVSGAPFGHFTIPSIAAGVTSFSVKYTGGTGSGTVNTIVGEWSRSGGTGAVDQLSSVATGTSTTFAAGPISPSVTNSLALAFWHQNASQACSNSGTFTHLSDIGDGTNGLCVMQDILSSNTPVTGNGSVGSSATYYGYVDNKK